MRLPAEAKVNEVGLRLRVPQHDIDSMVNSHTNPAEAAHGVLKKWRRSVGDAMEARRLLCDALLASGLRRVVAEVLDAGVEMPVIGIAFPQIEL